ncbi:homogentisate 1,2-dioxygenase [Pseudenhygromyxa sp. WMMC2535]|nr:homogentisate 1,2-dioxygenase [Pseudenhygromyxa sp. WMMC2535]
MHVDPVRELSATSTEPTEPREKPGVAEPAYSVGFGNTGESEALPGALPRGQNGPREVPYGLYAEQINGTSFTVPRAHNQRAWLYRIMPSVAHGAFTPLGHRGVDLAYLSERPTPDLVGWRPVEIPPAMAGHVDFIDGLHTVAGAGDPSEERGLAIHLYAANASMRDRALYSGDGDMMLIPDTGGIRLRTEFGVLHVQPGEIAVVPRGIKFAVEALEDQGEGSSQGEGARLRGLVLEVYARHFELPDRGPIGANGLADARHFFTPVAAYEDREVEGFEIVAKHGGELWRAEQGHSCFDVVAWHGNYAPYKWSFDHFNAIGSVSFDHPDPSIFTVLSAKLDEAGENAADLVIFPDRWDVAKHSFRPPYYHRNAATEFNAIVTGPSNAEQVFTRGGHFMTPPFTAHGVKTESYERAVALDDAVADAPRWLGGASRWIQFETTLPLRLSPWAAQSGHRDPGFRQFASRAERHFDPSKP